MKISVLGVVKRDCCPKSLWHQLVVCGALARGRCRLSAQTVPENSLHHSVIHFKAFNRRHSFRRTANTANNSSFAPANASVAHAHSECSDACASADPLCLGCDNLTRQLTPRLSAHTGMFHPGNKTMPLRSEQHAKHGLGRL